MAASARRRHGGALTEYATTIALIALGILLVLLAWTVATGALYQRVSETMAPGPAHRSPDPLPYDGSGRIGGGDGSNRPPPGDTAATATNDEPPDTGVVRGGQGSPLGTSY